MRKKFLFTLMILNSIMMLSQQMGSTDILPRHKEIRGSKISMVPPKDFILASTFLGFQEEKTSSSIMILDAQKSFTEVSAGLTNENLLKQGVLVEQRTDLLLNGVPSLLIQGEQTAYEILFSKYILVFGTEKETIIINGIAPKTDFVLNSIIKESLLSTIYHADKIITPMDKVDFEIDVIGTEFIFAKITPNMLIYNRDGKMPTESDDKASFVVAKTFSKLAIGDKKTFALTKIRTLPVQIINVNLIQPIEINGLKGFEITAEGVNRKTGIKEKAYQVILFTDEGYYILFGSTQNNFETNLALFKKVARTFKQKQ